MQLAGEYSRETPQVARLGAKRNDRDDCIYRLAMQLPITAQKLSETQKFPKQSPIRLVPLVYDHLP